MKKDCGEEEEPKTKMRKLSSEDEAVPKAISRQGYTF